MRFGSREICDVVFKAKSTQTIGKHTFNPGQPVFMIDTATASTMSQETSVVYAQGGKGYNRLIAWEGEKTMTFTVTDALMSPMGLAVLTGASVKEDSQHFHVNMDVTVSADGTAKIELDELAAELGLSEDEVKNCLLCDDIPAYGMILDAVGAVNGYVGEGITLEVKGATRSNFAYPLSGAILVTFAQDVEAGDNVRLDFYIIIPDGATMIRVLPESFGGYFYVEAATLYRNENGKDMAANLTFPKVKIQSAFEMAMSPTGDPSTFDFTMDAMPDYTMFDRKKKTCVDIQIIGSVNASNVKFHEHVQPADPHNLDESKKDVVLTLNAIKYEAADDEAGTDAQITLTTNVAEVPGDIAVTIQKKYIGTDIKSVTATAATIGDPITLDSDLTDGTYQVIISTTVDDVEYTSSKDFVVKTA